MNHVVQRVKTSLNLQHYTMNDSWLCDCVEYYSEEHNNPTLDEITTFAASQWLLADLRDINNEIGCLPTNLASQKFTKLPGKYILQMDKMYDISQSKYKQLEKIRNVSNDNVEATENENAAEEDKFQAWEPKSKRMLQLFLTDGAQDILAIEYKPIRFLKDTLLPGYKIMIKGPVVCRKGVLLLEELNISLIGGEVDSLLIPNAIENIFARTLNLQENPDPYNDNNKDNKSSHSSAKNISELNEDFEIDSDILDQLEKEDLQYTTSTKKHSSESVKNQSHNQSTESRNGIGQNLSSSSKASKSMNQSFNSLSSFNYEPDEPQNDVYTSKNSSVSTLNQKQMQPKDKKSNQNHSSCSLNALKSTITPVSKKQQPSNIVTTSSASKSASVIVGCSYDLQENKIDFDDNDDEILEMVDEREFKNLPMSKTSSAKVRKQPPQQQSTASRTTQHQNSDEFPTDEEMYDFNEIQSSYFNNVEQTDKQLQQNSKKIHKMSLKGSIQHSQQNSSKSTEIKETFSSNYLGSSNCKKLKLPSPPKPSVKAKPVEERFPDDKDFEIESQDFNEYLELSQKSKNSSTKSNETSAISSKTGYLSSSSVSSKIAKNLKNDVMGVNFDNEFKTSKKNEIQVENKNKNENENLSKFNETKSTLTESSAVIQNRSTVSPNYQTGIKRLSSMMSPSSVQSEPKIRCLKNPSVDDETKEYLDFINGPSILDERLPVHYEFIFTINKKPFPKEPIRTVVRGIVKNVVKLNLLSGNDGHYFYLDGTITDTTDDLDVVFSSEVLEKEIGFTPAEFRQKRKQSKTDPSIKDKLREDLSRTQDSLKAMDEWMELELKFGEKARVTKTLKMKTDQRIKYDEFLKKNRKFLQCYS